MAIRVLIADDHAVVAECLKHVVAAEAGMQVVGVASDGREALHQAQATEPDVVLMDLSMPELNGADAIRAILERHASCRIVVLSMHDKPLYIHRALNAGAAGYVVKCNSSNDVVRAIRAVHAGERFLCPRATEVLLQDEHEEQLGNAPVQLSYREAEVVQLIAEGRSSAQIAARLSLSPKTVETYRSRAFQKLGIHSVPEAVKFALRSGIIATDSPADAD